MPRRHEPATASGAHRATTGTAPSRTPEAVPPAPEAVRPAPETGTDAARRRLALAQTALLSALVAGTPVPEGFDGRRLRVQSRALLAKRASVVAKVAPELPRILGADFRPAFEEYARNRPMAGGYRRDALDFAARVLARGLPADPGARRELTWWWRDRSGARPPRSGAVSQLTRALRRALERR